MAWHMEYIVKDALVIDSLKINFTEVCGTLILFKRALEKISPLPDVHCQSNWALFWLSFAGLQDNMEMPCLAGQQMKSGIEHRGSTIYSKYFYQPQQKLHFIKDKKKSLPLQTKMLITLHGKCLPSSRH